MDCASVVGGGEGGGWESMLLLSAVLLPPPDLEMSSPTGERAASLRSGMFSLRDVGVDCCVLGPGEGSCVLSSLRSPAFSGDSVERVPMMEDSGIDLEFIYLQLPNVYQN